MAWHGCCCSVCANCSRNHRHTTMPSSLISSPWRNGYKWFIIIGLPVIGVVVVLVVSVPCIRILLLLWSSTQWVRGWETGLERETGNTCAIFIFIVLNQGEICDTYLFHSDLIIYYCEPCYYCLVHSRRTQVSAHSNTVPYKMATFPVSPHGSPEGQEVWTLTCWMPST